MNSFFVIGINSRISLAFAKKAKGKERTGEDRFLNSVISSFRVRVEHTLAAVKRCRIVKDIFRNHKDGFSDLVMEVACALHNLRIACRNPQPALKLLNFCSCGLIPDNV